MTEADNSLAPGRLAALVRHTLLMMLGRRPIGSGKWTPDDVTAAVAARDRTAAGPTAPPEGLYLTEVVYPSGI